jgi:hypothetical protein
VAALFAAAAIGAVAAPVAAADTTAPVVQRGGYGCGDGWGGCLHDVRCRHYDNVRECVGWDGDRPWRSYDEWTYVPADRDWHDSPDWAEARGGEGGR